VQGWADSALNASVCGFAAGGLDGLWPFPASGIGPQSQGCPLCWPSRSDTARSITGGRRAATARNDSYPTAQGTQAAKFSPCSRALPLDGGCASSPR
jgi:hypothetical protein